MKRILLASVLGLVTMTTAHAAIEIDETRHFGPSYGSTMADVTIGKPLQVVGAVLGTVAHVVNLPFAMASDSVDQSYDTLVRGPWEALQRCSGCTPAHDNYLKSQQNPQGQVRFVVMQPSEIIINTNDTVVVTP